MEIDLDAGAVEVLVPPRDLGLDDGWFPEPEPISFPTAGGETAHGLLYRPANPHVAAPDGERPPLLVMIHGGPTAAARPMLQLSRHYWTSRGFAVVDVNYRGSTGLRPRLPRPPRGQWGVADVEDCAAVCAFLVERGDVDPDRLCIRGGSAGGFTTLAALTFHEVFAAGASHYGVADLAVLAEETHKFESRYLDGLVGPWPEARDVYEARSPIFHTERIDRPLAVFQGLDDPVVPPNQAEMIVDALPRKGVPVAYLAFEGEQHGFRQSHNIRAALDGELSFYAQVLGFDLPEDEGITPIEVENVAAIRADAYTVGQPTRPRTRGGGVTGSSVISMASVEGLQGAPGAERGRRGGARGGAGPPRRGRRRWRATPRRRWGRRRPPCGCARRRAARPPRRPPWRRGGRACRWPAPGPPRPRRRGGAARRVAALRPHHPPPHVHGPAVGQRRGGVGVVEPGQVEHLAGEVERELDDVGRAAAGQHLDRLDDLERVAGRATQRDVHLGEQRGGAHPVGGAELHHRPRPARAPARVPS